MKTTILFSNTSELPKLIIVEPWVEWYWIDTAETVSIVCISEIPGFLEITHSKNGIIIYAWESCFIEIYKKNHKMIPSPQIISESVVIHDKNSHR